MNKQTLEKMRRAGQLLAQTSEESKNSCLLNLEKIIQAQQRTIIKANKKDLALARKKGLAAPLLQRLKLDSEGLAHIAKEIKVISKLKSGLDKIIEKKIVANGLELHKVAVPLGVILAIYESRPEVTIDVAALCIKSGNAVILKGGAEAINTNRELFACIVRALKESGIDEKAVAFIETRREVGKLLLEDRFVDLVIARGGYDLVKAVRKRSIIPVLAHSAGGARIYIDQSADLKMARKIIINAKTSKPSACNSLDTIVIHQAIAKTLIPRLIKDLSKRGVKIVSDRAAYQTEFLDLKIALKVVRNINEALGFINRYSKKHSEGIIASDIKAIAKFTKAIDAAALFVNCSTRLHDGYVFGLGSEMGIATGKLHARGPIGLRELLTYKWKIYGHGQIRK